MKRNFIFPLFLTFLSSTLFSCGNEIALIKNLKKSSSNFYNQLVPGSTRGISFYWNSAYDDNIYTKTGVSKEYGHGPRTYITKFENNPSEYIFVYLKDDLFSKIDKKLSEPRIYFNYIYQDGVKIKNNYLIAYLKYFETMSFEYKTFKSDDVYSSVRKYPGYTLTAAFKEKNLDIIYDLKNDSLVDKKIPIYHMYYVNYVNGNYQLENIKGFQNEFEQEGLALSYLGNALNFDYLFDPFYDKFNIQVSSLKIKEINNINYLYLNRFYKNKDGSFTDLLDEEIYTGNDPYQHAPFHPFESDFLEAQNEELGYVDEQDGKYGYFELNKLTKFWDYEE